MTDDDWQLIEAGVEIVVMILAARALFAWDEKRMTDDERARAWPEASRGMVTYAPLWFSPLWLVGVPLHFLRTRKGLRGVGLALLWTLAMFALLMATGLLFDLVSAR